MCLGKHARFGKQLDCGNDVLDVFAASLLTFQVFSESSPLRDQAHAKTSE